MKSTYDWFPQHSKPFSTLKEGMSKSVVLHQIKPDTTLSLTTDTSETANGAALKEVLKSDKNQPLAFFSRRLKQARRNYSTFQKHFLAIYAENAKFRYLIKKQIFLWNTNP